jgi:beta-glucanase (GH16 family)
MRHFQTLVARAIVQQSIAILTLATSALNLNSKLASDARLVWNDEFSGPAGAEPNPEKWSYDLGAGGWGNSELENYTSTRENSFLDGRGHLVISARRANGKFTSARLKTAGKFETQKGRVEARIRVPFGQGIWPAFWMLGVDVNDPAVGWPNCGEIDIMEHIGREPSRVYATVHGPGYAGANGISGHSELPSGQRFSDDFHVFAVDRTQDSLNFSVDGNQYQKVMKSALPPRAKWAFDYPFYLLLNVAVGGQWPGHPDDTTRFPQQMLVDYVRIYTVN